MRRDPGGSQKLTNIIIINNYVEFIMQSSNAQLTASIYAALFFVLSITLSYVTNDKLH